MMKRIIKALRKPALVAGFLLPAVAAIAQTYPGQFPANTVYGNATGATAAPTPGQVTGSQIAAGTVAGSNIAAGTVANSNLANMAAGTVKSNNTGSSAAPADNTTLPNPFSAGTSLYPVVPSNPRVDANSAFDANTLLSKNAVIGLPSSTTGTTWVNSDIAGVDQACNTTVGCVSLNVVSPNGFHGGVFASRSSDQASGTPQNIIPIICDSRHDNTSVAHQTWCRYTLGITTSGSAAAPHINDENSLVNQQTAVAVDPYTINPSRVAINQRLDCGNGVLTGNDCSAALDIVPNGHTYISGINIGNGALDTGSGNANPDWVMIPAAYSQSWFSAAATRVWQLNFAGTSNGNLNLTTTGTGTFSVSSNLNSTLPLQVSNTNAGASAGALVQATSNAGTAFIQALSTAGGSFGILRWSGSATFLVDAQNATGNFSFRTGATPTAALNISASQVISLPAVATGTPAASLCIDASNNVIKKTTAGSCI